MKSFIKTSLTAVLFLSLLTPSFSQDDTSDGNEEYVKTNVAVTKFRILGVTRTQYAKCLETENYLEPDKKLKVVVIGKNTFADNGSGYDLQEGDGILTSTEIFNYEKTSPVLVGTYRETEDYSSIIADEGFAFFGSVNRQVKVKLGCKVKWVPCNQMTHPGQAWLCNWAGWPYGSFVIVDCEFGLEF